MFEAKYHKPSSVDEAASLIASAEDGAFLSGGHTLIPTMKQGLAAPSDLVDLRGIKELHGIRMEGDTLVIGATTTHADVHQSSEVRNAIPTLAEMAGTIGDSAVRHVGTIGGSVANNDPSADYPSAVLGLGGTVVTNKREIAADDYFQGMFMTALEDGEIVTAVKFPKPTKSGYSKMTNPASRYPMVGVFVAQTGSGVRVAITGTGDDGVFRHEGLENALSSDFSAGAVDGVSVSADNLLSDIHGSADYRAALIKVHTKRAVANAK